MGFDLLHIRVVQCSATSETSDPYTLSLNFITPYSLYMHKTLFYFYHWFNRDSFLSSFRVYKRGFVPFCFRAFVQRSAWAERCTLLLPLSYQVFRVTPLHTLLNTQVFGLIKRVSLLFALGVVFSAQLRAERVFCFCSSLQFKYLQYMELEWHDRKSYLIRRVWVSQDGFRYFLL